MRIRPLLLAVLLPLVASACSFFGRAGVRVGAGTPPDEGRLRFQVANWTDDDATVHVLGGGGRYLGMIRSQSSEIYDVEWSREEALRFRVQVAGGDRCTTSLVTGAPGETVHLDIEEPLLRSSPSCR